MNEEVVDLLLSSETFQGVYSYDTNDVSLHLNYHYFAYNLTKEDLEEMVLKLKQLQEYFV